MLITRIWAKQPGEYFFLATKSRQKGWEEYAFKRSEFKEVDEFVKENMDKDIYACPHGFSRAERKKEYAVAPRLLWADLDEIDPKRVAIKPSMAWETSPGRFAGLWVTDKPITEDFNRRLTYALGADKGGWDFTQVLRLIAGCINYKYTNMPKVKLLWADGESVTLRELDQMLPADPKIEIKGDASEVYRLYEKSMPPWLRRELIKGKPTIGKRSEMLWKLGNTLLELGVSRDEAFLLIKASPWNKFAGRNNEDEQLTRELDKALSEHVSASKPREDKKEQIFLAKSMEEVEEENIDWLWYPYLARGELSILEGDPGLGKSYVAQMVASGFVDGKRLPSVKRLPVVQGRVAYFDIENSPGTVTKKRLTGNGCVNMKDYYQDDQPFSIDDEEALTNVYKAIERVKPVLVVFDTINTYIGSADTYKASETQQALGHFKEIAKRFSCSVLVLRHLTKSTKERALYRGQGSISFTGLARSVMTVGTSPDDDEVKVIAVTKLNIGKIPQALTYSIRGLPDTAKDKDRSVFEWGDFVDLTSDEILAAPRTENKEEKEEAVEFLKDVLGDGPVHISKVETMAEARSISKAALKKAVRQLHVEAVQNGSGKMWKMNNRE